MLPLHFSTASVSEMHGNRQRKRLCRHGIGCTICAFDCLIYRCECQRSLKSETVKPALKQVSRFRMLLTMPPMLTVDTSINFLLYLRNRVIDQKTLTFIQFSNLDFKSTTTQILLLNQENCILHFAVCQRQCFLFLSENVTGKNASLDNNHKYSFHRMGNFRYLHSLTFDCIQR